MKGRDNDMKHHESKVRSMDALGRILLPSKMRKHFGVGPKDSLEFFVDEGTIILKKLPTKKETIGDVFTGETEDLVEYMGKKVSRRTIKNLLTLAGIEMEE